MFRNLKGKNKNQKVALWYLSNINVPDDYEFNLATGTDTQFFYKKNENFYITIGIPVAFIAHSYYCHEDSLLLNCIYIKTLEPFVMSFKQKYKSLNASIANDEEIHVNDINKGHFVFIEFWNRTKATQIVPTLSQVETALPTFREHASYCFNLVNSCNTIEDLHEIMEGLTDIDINYKGYEIKFTGSKLVNLLVKAYVKAADFEAYYSNIMESLLFEKRKKEDLMLLENQITFDWNNKINFMKASGKYDGLEFTNSKIKELELFYEEAKKEYFDNPNHQPRKVKEGHKPYEFNYNTELKKYYLDIQNQITEKYTGEDGNEVDNGIYNSIKSMEKRVEENPSNENFKSILKYWTLKFAWAKELYLKLQQEYENLK